MSQVVLIFHLPDDMDAARLAVNAGAMYQALYEHDQWLRDQIKYHDRADLQAVRDNLHVCMDDNDISLDMVS